MLKLAGPHIDFVDVHWYPGGGSAAEALAKTRTWTTRCTCCASRSPRTPAPDAGRIGISLTETNVGVGQNTQPGALFLADAYSGLIENGVFTVDWWNVHNGIGTVSTVAGQTDYNDFGLLSSGNCTADGTVCEPPMNTPFAPYHALQGDVARSRTRATRWSRPPPTTRWSRCTRRGGRTATSGCC